MGTAYGARVFRRAKEAPRDHGRNRLAHSPSRPEQAGRQGVLHHLPRGGMKPRSHSGMNDCQAQGSSRSLVLYCLGSHEAKREVQAAQQDLG